MARPDDGGGSTSTNQPQDWSNSAKPVSVDISSMRDYWGAMMNIYGEASGPAYRNVGEMAQYVRGGLMDSKDMAGAGVFQEGYLLAGKLMQSASDFRGFFMEALEGIQAIGNAAGVIAELYRTTDGSNSATIGDVDFAFADSLTPPSGFPDSKWTTLSADAATQQQGGQFSMAATMPLDQGVKHDNGDGTTTYTFPDGSTATVSNMSGYGYEGSGQSTTTVVKTSDGKVVYTTTDADMSVPGYSYKTQTQTNPDGSSSSTQTRTNPDGSLTVTTSTTDKDGNVTTGKPVTVQPDTHVDTDDSDPGPVQQAEQNMHVYGSNPKVYGHGY